MTEPTYRVRVASIQGVKHARNGVNNQDAAQVHEFSVPKWKKTFRIGLVSDGCSGIAAFSRCEVGANLTATYCLGRIQELILDGVEVAEVPSLLYHSLVNFLRTVSNLIMPPSVQWSYPLNFRGDHAFRNELTATDRFRVDYLMATLIGYIDDGTTLVTFQAGDGVIIVDGELKIVDQNDRPNYPLMGGGFDATVYDARTVRRLALVSDGIEELLKRAGSDLPSRLFEHNAESLAGLRALFDGLREQYPERVDDDMTAVTRELIGGEEDEEEPDGD